MAWVFRHFFFHRPHNMLMVQRFLRVLTNRSRRNQQQTKYLIFSSIFQLILSMLFFFSRFWCLLLSAIVQIISKYSVYLMRKFTNESIDMHCVCDWKLTLFKWWISTFSNLRRDKELMPDFTVLFFFLSVSLCISSFFLLFVNCSFFLPFFPCHTQNTYITHFGYTNINGCREWKPEDDGIKHTHTHTRTPLMCFCV